MHCDAPFFEQAGSQCSLLCRAELRQQAEVTFIKLNSLSLFTAHPDYACSAGFDPWVGKNPWIREWQPMPVFLLGEFHGQRHLVGYSSWGSKESHMTERLTLCSSPLAFWFSSSAPSCPPHFSVPWVSWHVLPTVYCVNLLPTLQTDFRCRVFTQGRLVSCQESCFLLGTLSRGWWGVSLPAPISHRRWERTEPECSCSWRVRACPPPTLKAGLSFGHLCAPCQSVSNQQTWNIPEIWNRIWNQSGNLLKKKKILNSTRKG